jgi:hypothetical protein
MLRSNFKEAMWQQRSADTLRAAQRSVLLRNSGSMFWCFADECRHLNLQVCATAREAGAVYVASVQAFSNHALQHCSTGRSWNCTSCPQLSAAPISNAF